MIDRYLSELLTLAFFIIYSATKPRYGFRLRPHSCLEDFFGTRRRQHHGKCNNTSCRCYCPDTRLYYWYTLRTSLMSKRHARNVATKVLHSSYWATILRTDSVRTYAVRRPISVVSFFIPAATFLTALASIVTPLGLYEGLGTGDTEVGNFSYIRDTSAYFYGTSPRGRYAFSRLCFVYEALGPCPFTNDTIIYSNTTLGEGRDYPNNLTTDIPPILYKIYSSGTEGIATTISNFSTLSGDS